MKILEALQEKYKLAPKENERIYQELISPDFFAFKSPSQNRVAFYLAGQPGSGKSVLENYLNQTNTEAQNSVLINSDEIRTFHPLHDKLLSHPVNFAAGPAIISPDTTIWYQKLVQNAVKGGYNLFVDTTLGAEDIKPFAGTMKAIADKGYALQLHILAVKDLVSKLGVYIRYESQVKIKGFGRFVPMEYQDNCYRNLPKNIRDIERLVPLDNIGLFKRKLEFVDNNFVNNDVVRVMEGRPDAHFMDNLVASINDEHTRPLTKLEKEYLQMRYEQIEDLIKSRGGNTNSFEKDMQPLLLQVEDKESKKYKR